MFTILALNYIRPVHYSIFQPCIPAVATIISILYGLEKFSILKCFGILCAISGAIVSKQVSAAAAADIKISMDDSIIDDKDIAFGTLLVVVQVSCMGLLLVLQKTLSGRYDSTVLAFSYYAVASVITLAVSVVAVVLEAVVIEHSGNVSVSVSVSDTVSVWDLLRFGGEVSPWFALLYAALSTFYTNNAYAWAGKQVSPSVTAIYNTFQPVFTALLSVVFLSEVLTVFEIAGSGLVVVGMVATLYGRQLEVKEEARKAVETTSKKKES